MTISDEDFHKMFEIVREIQANYTKAIERENETLRNMLAETQKQLDEAMAALEKLKSKSTSDQYEELRKKFEKMKDMYPDTIPGIGTGGAGPWTTRPYPPTITWTTNNTTEPYGGSAATYAGSHVTADDYLKMYKQQVYAKMNEKADDDG
jgi:hypothetical protein